MAHLASRKSRKDAPEEQAISVAGETGPAPDTDISGCPRCGMPRKEWFERKFEKSRKGYKKENRTYCCEGCAQNTGCECL